MPLSVPHLALLAKQYEIAELKRLQSRSHLVALSGIMIHTLQSERGSSSLYLASGGAQFEPTRLKLINESQQAEQSLRQSIEASLENLSCENARLLALLTWLILGLDSLPELRRLIGDQQIDGDASVTAFSRIIAGLISLSFEIAATSSTPAIAQRLLSLSHLIQAKELAGQERAIGALAYGSGHCRRDVRQKINHLIEAQQHNFQLFARFCSTEIAADWQQIENGSTSQQLQQLRRPFRESESEQLDSNLSEAWFESCSQRLDQIWRLQKALIEEIQQQCEVEIERATLALHNSTALLEELHNTPPTRSELVARFLDPQLPIEQSLNFNPQSYAAHSHLDSLTRLLLEQSDRLAQTETELSETRRVLQERKIIERAKGVLMVLYQISEAAAYKQLRKLSMDENKRMVEVAAAVIHLTAEKIKAD